jgi:tRNA(fMet)-specific endonuclease VapC
MAMIVADTDVLIDFLRGRAPAAERVALELATQSLGTTAITAFELRSGARSPRQQRAVSELLDVLTVLPLTVTEAAIAADLRLELEKRGEGIGMADYLIAAICLSRRAILLTRNRKHFGRVAGLSVAALPGD